LLENVIINLERLVWTSIFIHPLRKYFLPIIVAINRLLAGILALILIAGVAQSSEADPEDIIFENGNTAGNFGFEIDRFIIIEDFMLDEDATLTDVHFVMILSGSGDSFNKPVDYKIIANTGSGTPDTSNIIASGNAVNVVMTELIPSTRFEVAFDLATPVTLNAGVRYWLGLHVGSNYANLPEDPRWTVSDVQNIGANTYFATSDSLAGLGAVGGADEPWFQLTSKKQVDDGGNGKVIGGEIIPIESTGLLLAGIQSSAIWMLPALAGIAGAGAYFVPTRMNKE